MLYKYILNESPHRKKHIFRKEDTYIKSAETALPWAGLGRGKGPVTDLTQTRNGTLEHTLLYKYANTLNCIAIIPATGQLMENK